MELEAKAPGSWYVNVLAAFPEFRGQGLGTRLLERAEERARTAGAREASVIVASANTGAARLYARCRLSRTGAPVRSSPGPVPTTAAIGCC